MHNFTMAQPCLEVLSCGAPSAMFSPTEHSSGNVSLSTALHTPCENAKRIVVIRGARCVETPLLLTRARNTHHPSVDPRVSLPEHVLSRGELEAIRGGRVPLRLLLSYRNASCVSGWYVLSP